MFVYADNAATTSVSKTALEAMLPYLTEDYGNPSSLYAFGQRSAEALARAREDVAACLNADPKEIYFTSGGSEADNQAIISAARSECIGGTLYLCGRDAVTGELLRDTTSCSMCRRNVINAGISQVIIRNTPTEYTVVDVEDWIKNDESIQGISCGAKIKP